MAEELEDRMQIGVNKDLAKGLGYEYYVPYIDSLEINVPDIGRVSTNALDTLAKYAAETGTPLEEALGLSAQETNFGAVPRGNMADAKHPQYNEFPDEYTNEEWNNMLGNASYFRNFGKIPAAMLVRNFHYYKDLTNDQRSNEHPLVNAFNYWRAGKYNPGDPKHTNDVKRKGREVMATKPIQKWVSESEYAQKALKKK